jgi:hypothetical protein
MEMQIQLYCMIQRAVLNTFSIADTTLLKNPKIRIINIFSIADTTILKDPKSGIL